jgi:AcrR family transcriptional regulator
MKKEIVNKSGQPLGQKGTKTRSRLMTAAQRLLKTTSPMSLTVAAIAKEARTAPATFYVYFSDVEEVLWALCDSISEDTSNLFPNETFLRTPKRLEADALNFVTAYNDIWTRHSTILLYRNLEADRGNAKFNRLLVRVALPVLTGLTERIVEAGQKGRHAVSRSEANAEAVVFVAALDRIAAATLLYPEQSLTPDILQHAQARILVRMLRRPD